MGGFDHVKMRSLREDTGLSQEGLARKVGVAYGTLCRWEWGRTTPRADHLVELANALDVDVGCLLIG